VLVTNGAADDVMSYVANHTEGTISVVLQHGDFST
jgi:hypothetical protein